MGIFGAKEITTIITGKDQNGKVVYQTTLEKMGSVMGTMVGLSDTISALERQYPGLVWEYEVWKD